MRLSPALVCVLLVVAVGGAQASSERWALVADYPSWSPDGKRIAFTETRPGSPPRSEIVVVGATGGRLRTFADGALVPRWSPDGSHVAYLRLNDQNIASDLWIAGEDGTSAQLVAHQV